MSESNHDAFDFVQADSIAGAVVEFRGADGIVSGDALGVLRGPAILPPLSGLNMLDGTGKLSIVEHIRRGL